MKNVVEDLRDIVVFILYNNQEENTLEVLERNPNFTRHIQYYRMLLFGNSRINHYIHDIDFYETPSVLADHGNLVFNNLDMKKRKEENGKAMIWLPDSLTDQQILYLYSLLDQFHHFSKILLNQWNLEKQERVDLDVNFEEYILEQYQKLNKTKKR